MKTWNYITEDATTAAGMTKRDTILFHLFNLNGAIAQLPVYEDFYHNGVFFVGAHYIYSKDENYHSRWLMGADPKKVTKWEINYAISKIFDAAVKGKECLAKKRADA